MGSGVCRLACVVERRQPDGNAPHLRMPSPYISLYCRPCLSALPKPTARSQRTGINCFPSHLPAVCAGVCRRVQLQPYPDYRLCADRGAPTNTNINTRSPFSFCRVHPLTCISMPALLPTSRPPAMCSAYYSPSDRVHTITTREDAESAYTAQIGT